VNQTWARLAMRPTHGATLSHQMGAALGSRQVPVERAPQHQSEQNSAARVGSVSTPAEIGTPRGTGDARVHDAARRGTSGPSGPLPFHDVIQRSFGRHDTSGIEAHTDRVAAASAQAIGAVAFTTGNHVVFSGMPTLRTTAHEAAHGVQQREGIQVAGRVGTVGDHFERHADAVADLVVRGQSAEALLDELSGSQRRSVGVRAGAGLVQRQSPTREEMLLALRTELADAATDPSRYQNVALRLNGFNRADIKRLTAGLSVEQMRGTRAAVEHFLAGWPEQQTILDALDGAARAKGARLRPQSSSIWAAYSRVAYKVLQKQMVWEFVGGSVGKGFENENTCATRVSYAFNYGGYPIQGAKSGWSYRNDPKTVYRGKAGDGLKYIVSAPYMQEYLTNKWGPPEATLRTNADARTFEATLLADQIAVFAGIHHSGIIKHGYADAYVLSDPGVMPVVAWKLP
jgi:hypothetical protein